MAAELAGTAAIRLVPSLAGFRARAQTELQRQKGLAVDVDIRPRVDTSTAKRQLDRFRAKEQADAINLKAKVDEAEFRRSFQRVEHVFERSAFAKALRLQIKVVGLDGLYALSAAGAAAAASLDTVMKSAVILPGALAAAGVAAGVFAVALGDIGKAITAVKTEQDQAADKARAFEGALADGSRAARDVTRAHQDVARATEGIGRATRAAIRDFEDLAHAVRGTSLDEADALLNVQESYDRLAQGGFQSLTELRRAQLSYARDLHALDGVRTQNKRTLEDYNDAQRKGLAGSDQVVAAQDRLISTLDAVEDAQNRVADASRRMADATQTKTMTGAYSRLAPAAKEFVDAVTAADGAWVQFTNDMQQGVFEGQAKNLTDTINSLVEVRPALQGVAGQIGGVFKDLGAILRRDDIRGMINGIVTGTGNTISTIRQGLDPLISGFMRMAEVGVRHLPQLVDVFNRLWERFDAFTQRAAADGTLDRWITNGIRGFEQMLLVGENVIGIVSDVANAWRAAGGEQSGLIQNAADLTTEIRKWTSSQAGQDSMVNNFRNMRKWLGDVWDALQNIWPTVQGVVQTIREWSAAFLTVLGHAFQLTSWVQEHTGLVKFLVLTYLSIRTVKPIWDMLSNAAAAYQNVLLKGAAAGHGWAQSSVAGLAQVQDKMGKTGTAAQTLNSTFTRSTDNMNRSTKGWSGIFTNAVDAAGRDMARLQGGAANTATSMTNMGTQAGNAGKQVGAMGTSAGTAASAVGTSARTGLWGAAAGLGAFLGPMALAMVATGGIIWAIDKMGEAHRKAAAEAENQKNQLQALKTTLDQFTGAFTAQTAIDTSKTAQDFQTQHFGKRNVLQDIVRTGVASPEALIGATNPVNQAQRTAIAEQLRTGAAGKLAPMLDKEFTISGGGTSSMRRQMQGMGLTEQDYIGVLTGDGAAIAKWNEAVRNQPGGEFAPGAMPGAAAIGQGAQKNVPPEVWDYLTTLQFLNNTAASQVQGGADIKFGNQAALGEAKLRDGVTHYGDVDSVQWTGPDTAKIVTRDPIPNPEEYVKNFPSDVGTVEILPGGRAQITLTREATARDIERKAQGGMIRGVGSGTSDSNIIAASRGEYIIRKAAVDAIGVQTLDRMNMGRFWTGGGPIGGMPFPLKPPVGPPPPINPTPAPVTPAPYTPTVETPPPAPVVPAPAPTAPTVPVPTQYPATPTPTTSMPYSPTMTGITGPVGPLGPVSVSQDAPQGPILDYLTKITQQSGLRVGSSVRDEPGSWHHTGNALDIGNGPDAIPLAQWWIQDPARVANTKELILSGPGWDPMMNIKDGKFVRDYGGGVYDQGTLDGHADHLHLALGGVPIGGMPMMNVNGQPVAYDPYNPTVNYGGVTVPGMPGGSTSGTQSNLPLGDRIANMYAEALKPENVNKFLLGQVENVGQSMMAIGFQFLKGFTGIDFGQIYSPAQQIISHFTGAGTGSGSGTSSTLQAGSPMDQQISGNLNSFFDPMAGMGPQIAGMVQGANGSTHGASSNLPGPAGAGQVEIARYIMQKALSEGYTPQQAMWFITQAFGESGLNPGANGGNQDGTGDVMGIFQFTPGTWGSRPGSPGDAKRNIDEYFNLARERGLTPQTFTDPTQLGTQVSKGGPYHPSNVGHRERAESGVGSILSALGIPGFAGGGAIPIRVSRGEYRMSPAAVARYGPGFMHAVNSLGGFAGGGLPGGILKLAAVRPKLPIKPPVAKHKEYPQKGTPDHVGPKVPMGPDLPVTPAYPIPAPGAGGIPGVKPPAPGVPAPTPGPGYPPATPLVDPAIAAQERGLGVVAPAPTTNNHLPSGIKGAIEGGFQAAGQAMATAGSIAGGMGMPGAGQAGALMQSGMQMAGQFASGLANVAASAGVGTIHEIGTQATPSGTPLLPSIQPRSFPVLQTPDALAAQQRPMGGPMGGGFGGPAIVNNYFGGIHTQNMDEWNRRRQLLERQQEQPLTNTFAH